MLPEWNLERTELSEESDRTYEILTAEMKLGRIIDQLEAVKQAVFLILNIKRYNYLIYSWNYGVELNDLFGKDIDYACPEIKRRITEALIQDERIQKVDAFSFTKADGAIQVTFTVHTLYGTFSAGKEVTI